MSDTPKIPQVIKQWETAKTSGDWFHFVPIEAAARGLVIANNTGLEDEYSRIIGHQLAKAVVAGAAEVRLDRPFYNAAMSRMNSAAIVASLAGAPPSTDADAQG